MNKRMLVFMVVGLLWGTIWAQEETGKRERKKNLIVKEWNTKSGASTPYLDNIVTYDNLGRKIEEIEYASYGQKKRTVYEYEGNSTRCSRQIEYDSQNRVKRIKKLEYNDDGTKKRQYNYKPNGKLEYNDDGTKKRQYNYKPNGKLESTKVFEYSYK